MSLITKTESLPEKLNAFLAKVMKKDSKQQQVPTLDAGGASPDPVAEVIIPEGMRPSPDLSDYIAGEISDFKDELSPFLPIEMVAGEVPYVPGEETNTVWNAAAQACSTEKVHFTYAIDLNENKISYLACPSSSMAVATDSWCPLVTALPGNPEFIDKKTVYVYEQDASAAALRWHEDTGRIQLFIGASRTILPKIQSMDTNFVTIGKDNPNVIAWRNKQLKTEKLARALIRSLTLSGALISAILLVFLIVESFSLFFVKSSLQDVTIETKQASNQLIEDAYKVMHSDIIEHNARIQQLSTELYKVDGTLLKYEISKGKVVWEAFVPQAYVNSKNNAIKGTLVEGQESSDGRVRIRGTK